MSIPRNQFIYRQSIQLNFPIRLRSFLLHFLEKHIREALRNVLSRHQSFHFHLILKSNFSAQQNLVSLNIDPRNLESDELLRLIERNIAHLSLSAPVSSFDILVTSKKMKWNSVSHTSHRRKKWAPSALPQTAAAIA